MPPVPAISKEILQIAAQITVGCKGNADWISNPDKVEAFLEVIAKKLNDLNQGRYQ